MHLVLKTKVAREVPKSRRLTPRESGKYWKQRREIDRQLLVNPEAALELFKAFKHLYQKLPEFQEETPSKLEVRVYKRYAESRPQFHSQTLESLEPGQSGLVSEGNQTTDAQNQTEKVVIASTNAISPEKLNQLLR